MRYAVCFARATRGLLHRRENEARCGAMPIVKREFRRMPGLPRAARLR